MVKRFSALIFGAALFCVVAGCQSDEYYQNRAVEKARDYLLKHAPELSTEEMYYVKFHDPVLLTGPIVGDASRRREDERLNSEQQQICVCWIIPGREENYLVYGASGGNMEYWHPKRLIRKRFAVEIPLEERAIATARQYTLDNLFEQLSSAELNAVRFRKPVIADTAFELNLNPEGKLSEEEIAAVRKTLASQVQISIAWPSPDQPERMIVFCGMAPPKNIAGWKINFAGLMDRNEFDSGVIKLRTSE